MAESENYGRITMTEFEWHGRANMAESEWDSLWITLAESDWAGRVTLAESENALVSAYALVAAVRNFAYQSASLVRGASGASAHAWEKTVSAGPCVGLIWACRDDTRWAEVAWLWVSRGEAVCRP